MRINSIQPRYCTNIQKVHRNNNLTYQGKIGTSVGSVIGTGIGLGLCALTAPAIILPYIICGISGAAAGAAWGNIISGDGPDPGSPPDDASLERRINEWY